VSLSPGYSLAHHVAFIEGETTAIIDDLVAIGGTAQAQAVFTRLGFEEKPKLAIFQKVLAPFHRLRTTAQGLFRRWAEEQLRTWRPIGERAHRRCRRTSNCARHLVSPQNLIACHDSLHCALRRASVTICCSITCSGVPLPGFFGWMIHTSQQMIGFAVLKITPHGRIQLGKIVDCWLDPGIRPVGRPQSRRLSIASAPFLRTLSHVLCSSQEVNWALERGSPDP
jgi:hypothetical protein